jgi:hypothetical protein
LKLEQIPQLPLQEMDTEGKNTDAAYAADVSWRTLGF